MKIVSEKSRDIVDVDIVVCSFVNRVVIVEFLVLIVESRCEKKLQEIHDFLHVFYSHCFRSSKKLKIDYLAMDDSRLL